MKRYSKQLNFTGNGLICLFTPGNFDEKSLEKYVVAGSIPKGTTPDSNPVVMIIKRADAKVRPYGLRISRSMLSR